jgi:hypothetical protein
MLTMAIEKGQLFSRLLARCRHLTISSLVSSSQFLSSPIVKFNALLISPTSDGYQKTIRLARSLPRTRAAEATAPTAESG